MSMRAPRETEVPFRHARGEGAIVFDPDALSQTPAPEWFDPAHWGDAATRVGSGGRGSAWFVDAPAGPMLLRHYLRGGLMAKLSRDGFVWRGADAARSIAELRLLQNLHMRGLPVPRALAAGYWREGRSYRAAILLGRIEGVRSFGDRVLEDAASAPWAACGALIARFHRAGLDHADLNAHNLLFDDAGSGWVIDLDKSRLRARGGDWRDANLARLRRSLDKIGSAKMNRAINEGFAELQRAYDAVMQAGDKA